MRKEPVRFGWLVAGRSSYWVVLAAVLAVAIYVVFNFTRTGGGFPLDDSWIHQVYARNLARYGQWAFIPGQPSAGSTAPLWSILLSIGYFLPWELPFLWTFMLGAAFLALTAWLGDRLARSLSVSWNPAIPLVGIFLAFEWHLVWAAGSGMETALMAACVLAVFVLLAKGNQLVFWAGFVTGLTIWIRPDGVTLLGPIFFCLVLREGNLPEKIKAVGTAFGGFLLAFVPYLVFNQALAGNWWPNTFYAKQAEYAVLRELPFFTRLGSIAALPLAGPGALLVPGFVYQIVTAVRSRDWLSLAACLWWIGYTTLYALLLPVTYQHGRYLIPAMPVFFVIGLIGTAGLVRSLHHRRLWVVRTAWVTAIPVAALLFFGIGANAYATDVAVIESEMVTTARWIAANTMPDDRIAVHDIGAVGYFSGREHLVDLAGLVSPDVIPFIRDETRLAEYLYEQQVDYLIIFPDWYPQLAEIGEPVFSTGSEITRQLGSSNMAIYRWLTSQQGSK